MRARARARRDAAADDDDDARARRARRDGDDGWSAAARLREASARGDVAAWTGDDARAFVNARGVDAIAGVGRARAREAATALSRALGATPRAGETTSALTTTTRDERRAPREAVDDGDGDARDAFSGRPGVARGVELDAEAFEGILADASERRDARALYAAQVPMARVGELDVDGTLYDEGFRRFCERHDAQRHCWINGAKRATTNLHYDNYDNVLAVLSGEKRVRLIQPSFCAGGGERPFGGVCAGADDSNHACGKLETAPTWRFFTLGPGESIFIPSGWYHEVTSAPFTVAVSHWWRNDFNAALETVLRDGRRSTYHFRRAFESALDVSVHNETESCRAVVREIMERELVKNRTLTYRVLDAYIGNFVPWDDVFDFLTRRGTSLITKENRLELGTERESRKENEKTVNAFITRIWLKDGIDLSVMARYLKAMTPDKNIATALSHALREAQSSASRSTEESDASRAHHHHDCIYAHHFDIFWRAVTTALESGDAESWGALYAAARCEEFPRNDDVVRAVLRNQKYAVAYRAQALLQDNLEDDDVCFTVDVRVRRRAELAVDF